jgi:hypothetical protein
MIENPIFIIGTERSGSNLLRAILNEHPNIAIPHPPHLLKELQPLIGVYGDLNEDSNFRSLIRDAIRLVELHFVPWPLRLDAELVFTSANHRDLYSIYALFQEQYLRFTRKKRWGCKSTFMVRHVDDILAHHLRPQMIHLVRDGRDVAASARKSVFNHYHPHYVAKLWARQQREAFEAGRRLPADLFLRVRYEDLLERPGSEVKRICDFLGESYSDNLLGYFQSREATELSALSASWKNLSRPILSGNVGKFHKELSSTEIFEFERVAADELVRQGYELFNDRKTLDAAGASGDELWKHARFVIEEKSRMLGVQALALVRDKNALQRMKKRLFVESIRFKGWLRGKPSPK